MEVMNHKWHKNSPSWLKKGPIYPERRLRTSGALRGHQPIIPGTHHQHQCELGIGGILSPATGMVDNLQPQHKKTVLGQKPAG